jgi:anti-anti-sigma factor
MAGVGENSTARMTYDVVEGGDRTLTVRLAGELDITNVEAIGAAVAPALERDPVRLIIDARDLRFADSSAIALWVQWASDVPEIELRDSSPLLRRVVESMGLAETLHVRP